MPFDFLPDDAHQGRQNYHDGLAAEGAVARRYRDTGFTIVAERWRSKAGEIDLICRDGTGYVFVEVKKSSTFDAAAARLTTRQLARIALAAEDYIGQNADPFSNMRLDLAMVDGTGQVSVLENLTLF